MERSRISKLFFLSFIFLFSLSANLSADEFEAANQVISGADSAGRSVLGTSVKWAFAVILPLAMFFGGMFLGYKQQKKKSEQEQETGKLYLVMGMFAIIGFFVYVIGAMFISKMLFGDFTSIFQYINEFWKSSMS